MAASHSRTPARAGSAAAGAHGSGSARSHPAGDFTTWLLNLADAQLITLLRARPEVAAPSPATIEVLSSRLQLPAATTRALDSLTLPSLTVLVAAAQIGAERGPVSVDELAARLDVDATSPAFTSALAPLRSAALLWGEEPELRISPTTAAALDAAPVVLPEPGEPGSGPRGPENLDAAWDGLDERAQRMVTTLGAARVPRGVLSADPNSPARAVVANLLSADLATVEDDGSILPRAHVLDRVRYGRRADGLGLLDPPGWAGSPRLLPDTDAAAGVAALELLHSAERVLDSLEHAPASSLKAGGIGVRELRRVSRSSRVEETTLPLILEVLAASGLIACGDADIDESPFDNVWAPTEESDLWRARGPARRWAQLVAAWWDLPRRPWKTASELEGGGTAAVLSDALYGPAAVLERRRAFHALSQVPGDLDPDVDTLGEILRQQWPVRFARSGGDAASESLTEARVLGLSVGLALTSVGRRLVAGDESGDLGADLSVDDLAELLEPLLPTPVHEVIVQGDLTILAPGPLVPELAAEFALIAAIESTGAATTYRITENSLRRAMDAGRSAAQLLDLLERTSVTPIPQSLGYLIEDVARRHGRLRVGSAESFVRCEDPAMLAQVLGSPVAERCALRALAPTVIISQARPIVLLDALRECGFTPVVEDPSGSVVALARRGARVRLSVSRRAARPKHSRPTTEELEAVVALMRSADRVRSAARETGGARRTGEAGIALLHETARTGSAVAVEVVDASGRAESRLLVPTSVGAGRLEGHDPSTGQPVAVALHRVISATVVGPTD